MQQDDNEQWAYLGFQDLFNSGEYVTIFDEEVDDDGRYVRWADGADKGSPEFRCGSYKSNPDYATSGLDVDDCDSPSAFTCEIVL